MRDIHKGGRPPVQRPAGFYPAILAEYNTMTIGQMAAMHRVSRTTINNWLRKAREEAAHGHHQKPES